MVILCLFHVSEAASKMKKFHGWIYSNFFEALLLLLLLIIIIIIIILLVGFFTLAVADDFH